MICATSKGCAKEEEQCNLVMFDSMHIDLRKIGDMEEEMRAAADIYRGKFKRWEITLENTSECNSIPTRKVIDEENAGILRNIFNENTKNNEAFEVDFDASFSSEELAKEAIEFIEESLQEKCFLSHNDAFYICTARLVMTPYLDAIGDIEEIFRIAAKKFNGIFRGWGISENLP